MVPQQQRTEENVMENIDHATKGRIMNIKENLRDSKGV
jgi:hypothetical protein